MRNITVEKVLLLVIAFILLYITVSFVQIHIQQENCLAALVSDLLGGKIVHSQVVCSGAIK